jgi:hypothetical protein
LAAYLADWWQFDAFIQGRLSNEQRREILDDLFIDEKRLWGSFINAESVITECTHESLTTVGAARRFDIMSLR